MTKEIVDTTTFANKHYKTMSFAENVNEWIAKGSVGQLEVDVGQLQVMPVPDSLRYQVLIDGQDVSDVCQDITVRVTVGCLPTFVLRGISVK